MFSDRDFYNSLRVTLKYVVLSVPLYMVLGLALALLLNQRLRGMFLFRSILFMPSVIAGTAVAVLWAILLNPDAGVVNQMLRASGISDPPRWLASSPPPKSLRPPRRSLPAPSSPVNDSY
jgi:ABC-type sugar transport system permease subunit